MGVSPSFYLLLVICILIEIYSYILGHCIGNTILDGFSVGYCVSVGSGEPIAISPVLP